MHERYRITPMCNPDERPDRRFRFPCGVRYALLVVLGYSRLLWRRFYPRQDMATLVNSLERLFSISGGCRRSCSSIG